MPNDSKKLKTKILAAAPALIISIITLIYVSDVNIFEKPNGNTGVLLGCLLGIFLLLIPLGYIRLKNIKVKNPKPLFIEPNAVIVTPLYLLSIGVAFFIFILIVSIPPFNFILDELDKDTFIGTFTMTCVILFSMFGPLIGYAIYIYTHFARIVEYNTPEWKKIRADRKAAKRTL